MAWWWLAACDGGSTSGIVPKDGDTAQFPDLSPDLVIEPGDLGSYSATWVFPVTPVGSGLDLYFDWSALTADAWGEDRPADGYAGLALLQTSTDRVDLAKRLAEGDVESVLTHTFGAPARKQTNAALSDLGVDPTTFLPDPSTTWLLALCDTDGQRLDIRSGLLLEPTDGAGTFLDFPNPSGRYTWQSKIGTGPETQAGLGDYTVDFSAITTDDYGQPFDPSSVDELFVGRFPNASEGDDLSGDIHDLQAVADGWWTMPLDGGTSYDLAQATGDGGPFPGFESGIAYLLGARCTSCFEPAPAWVVSVAVR